LQTIAVLPVLESIFVVTGIHAQVTVLAFSCFTTTQCSMSSADEGGIWLFSGLIWGAGAGGGGGAGAGAGGFLAAQPASSKRDKSQNFFITYQFAFLMRKEKQFC
jgi:hypothetical protein